MLSIDVEKYLKDISVSEDYSTNFDTLSAVALKLSELGVSYNVYEILLSCGNINSLVESIVNNNFDLIKGKGGSKLSKDKAFCNLVNAYCVINNSFVDDISTDDYYRFIDHINLLSAADENFLFSLLYCDDEQIKRKARDIIITCNLRLVRSIAHAYSLKNSRYNIDSLMEEGIYALIKAVNNYDISTGTKFSTYAYYAIRQRIIVFCSHDISHISFSYNFGEKMIVYMKIKDDYIKKNGKNPSYEYMKKNFCLKCKRKISDKVLRELFDLIEECSLDVLSLSMPIGPKESCYLENIVPDNNEPFYEKLERNELPGLFEKVFDELDISERNREVIYYLYGMNGYPKLVEKDVAKIFGVSYQRVQQIEKSLRNRVNNNYKCKRLLAGYCK